MRLIRTSKRSRPHWRVSDFVKKMNWFDYCTLCTVLTDKCFEDYLFFSWFLGRKHIKISKYYFWPPLTAKHTYFETKKKASNTEKLLQKRRNHSQLVIAKSQITRLDCEYQPESESDAVISDSDDVRAFKFHWFVELFSTNIRVQVSVVSRRHTTTSSHVSCLNLVNFFQQWLNLI